MAGRDLEGEITEGQRKIKALKMARNNAQTDEERQRLQQELNEASERGRNLQDEWNDRMKNP